MKRTLLAGSARLLLAVIVVGSVTGGHSPSAGAYPPPPADGGDPLDGDWSWLLDDPWWWQDYCNEHGDGGLAPPCDSLHPPYPPGGPPPSIFEPRPGIDPPPGFQLPEDPIVLPTPTTTPDPTVVPDPTTIPDPTNIPTGLPDLDPEDLPWETLIDLFPRVCLAVAIVGGIVYCMTELGPPTPQPYQPPATQPQCEPDGFCPEPPRPPTIPPGTVPNGGGCQSDADCEPGMVCDMESDGHGRCFQPG
jgi:hypothetical protein